MMKLLNLADASTKLVELESHPGIEHLRCYAPSGVTAQPWALIESALRQMWADLAELMGQPCDLRAVTRAVTDYQQMVTDKREKTR
jgi:hypothetical protein